MAGRAGFRYYGWEDFAHTNNASLITPGGIAARAGIRYFPASTRLPCALMRSDDD